jgi:hypothetical protein
METPVIRNCGMAVNQTFGLIIRLNNRCEFMGYRSLLTMARYDLLWLQIMQAVYQVSDKQACPLYMKLLSTNALQLLFVFRAYTDAHKQLAANLGKAVFLVTEDVCSTSNIKGIGTAFNYATGYMFFCDGLHPAQVEDKHHLIEATVAPLLDRQDPGPRTHYRDARTLFFSTAHFNTARKSKIEEALRDVCKDYPMPFAFTQKFTAVPAIMKASDGSEIEGVNFRVNFGTSIPMLYKRHYPETQLRNIAVLDFGAYDTLYTMAWCTFIPDRFLDSVIKVLLQWSGLEVLPLVRTIEGDLERSDPLSIKMNSAQIAEPEI